MGVSRGRRRGERASGGPQREVVAPLSERGDHGEERPMSEAKRSNGSGGVPRDPWWFQRWAWEQSVQNPTRKLLLLELAQRCERDTGYGWMDYEAAALFAECSTATVRAHYNSLAGHGLIARRREYRGGQRAADAFLLIADQWAAWPGDEPLIREPPSHDGNGHGPGGVVAKPQAGKRPPQRVEVPNFDELMSWQRRVVVELRRVADAKNASLHEMKALLACIDFPDRDHIGEAERFAAWFVEGKGAARARSDVNATWRTWLRNGDPVSAATSSRGSRGVAETRDLDQYEFGED